MQESRIGRNGFHCNRCDQIGFIDGSNSIRFARTRWNVIIQFDLIEFVFIAIDSIATVLSIGRDRSIELDPIRSISLEVEYPIRFDRIGFPCNRFDQIGFIDWSNSIEFDPIRSSSIEFDYSLRFDPTGFRCNRFHQFGFIAWSNSIRFDRNRSNLSLQLDSIELVSSQSIRSERSHRLVEFDRIRSDSIELVRVR